MSAADSDCRRQPLGDRKRTPGLLARHRHLGGAGGLRRQTKYP